MFGPLAPPVFMEVPASSQDRERSFIYVFGVSTFFLLDFSTCYVIKTILIALVLNNKPSFEEQTIQWPADKGQKYKQ
jgi:hypothetical protein